MATIFVTDSHTSLIFIDTDGRADGRTDRWTDEWTDGRTDGLTDGRTDGRTDKQTYTISCEFGKFASILTKK
jgi:hypothetical protein